MIFKPEIKLVESNFRSDVTTVVEEVKFSVEGLEIIVGSKFWKIKVLFTSTFGFRVLDEGDLSEFWSQGDLTFGWCYEVTKDGWCTLEKTREHFISGEMDDLREFLIIGINECVSVLSLKPPKIIEL